MVGDRWSDDRLDDLAHQVRLVSSMTTQLAKHDAKIDSLSEQVHDLGHLVGEVRDESREHARVNAWTPMVKAAVLGPTVASLIAAVALLLSRGGS